MSEENYTCKPDDVWPVGKKTAILTAVVAFGLGLFDFVDRQILASIIPFLKEEWGLTDAQCGMLVSAVNIAISVILIPSAYFIDRWSRKKMLAIASTIWSIATGLGGFTTSFIQLLCCRFTLGVGEGVYNPSAIPLLAASFPKKIRSTAISFTQIGTTLGVPLGTVLGAYIASHYGWRHVFFVVMVPGLILAFLSLFLKDYKTSNDEKARQSYWADIKEIVQIPSMRFVLLGAICFYFVNGMQMNWLPSYLVRTGNIEITEASLYFSIIFMFSIVATIVAGLIYDFARHFYKNAVPVINAICLISGSIFYIIAYSFCEPASMTQIICLGTAQWMGGLVVIGVYSCTVSVVYPRMSATGISIVIFAQNILGFAMGPLVTGILSDYFGLVTAIRIVVMAWAIGGISFIFCAFTYNRDVERAGCQDFHFGE